MLFFFKTLRRTLPFAAQSLIALSKVRGLKHVAVINFWPKEMTADSPMKHSEIKCVLATGPALIT